MLTNIRGHPLRPTSIIEIKAMQPLRPTPIIEIKAMQPLRPTPIIRP